MNWSDPNCDFLPKWITFGPDQFILVVTISFWSWPNHYGQVQINLVRPKPFWTDQNRFGHIEGQGISTQPWYTFALKGFYFTKRLCDFSCKNCTRKRNEKHFGQEIPKMILHRCLKLIWIFSNQPLWLRSRIGSHLYSTY